MKNESGYPIIVSTGEDDGQGGEITRVVQPGEDYELVTHDEEPAPATEPSAQTDAPTVGSEE